MQTQVIMRPSDSIELSIIMPCLNEIETLEVCIHEAQQFLADFNVSGEIVVGDNGSSDGSQAIATRCGARVIEVVTHGYGAAVSSAVLAARGKYVIMGDADHSYDFAALMPFLDKLREGFDLVMGNRFKGGIAPGAMPWKNRHIGNPLLTGIGRLLFNSPVGDFHCGLRGFSREAFTQMDLRTTGMEFASEMVIKATLLGLKISEVPTVLRRDGRSRQPHLRPWRDGWRHLRFMLFYRPMDGRICTPSPPPALCRNLCAGLLLIFLAFWKGNGGYHDLVLYLDDAEHLWLRGDLEEPRDTVYLDDLKRLAQSPAELEELIHSAEQRRYSKYSIGLPFISGPFVLLGTAIESLTGGRVSTRAITVLVVPVLGVLAALLVFGIGLELLLPVPVCLWAAIVFALGSPLLGYVRMYYTEVAIIFFTLLTLWAYLRSRYSPESSKWIWALATGAGLAGVTVCHYGNVFITVGLWIGMALRMLLNQTSYTLKQKITGGVDVPPACGGGRQECLPHPRQECLPHSRQECLPHPLRTRLLRIGALTLVPALTALALLWLNYSRYGHILGVGDYDSDVKEQLSLRNVPFNLRYLGVWLLRTPWLLAAIWFTGRLFKYERLLASGLMAAFVLQALFWHCYEPLGYSPLRYLEPLTALFAIGLLFLGQWVTQRWSRFGLTGCATVLIACNYLFFLTGEDLSRIGIPFGAMGLHAQPAFLFDPRTPHELLCYVWYMTPFPQGIMDGYGTPVGTLQWVVLGVLLSAGIGFLMLAVKGGGNKSYECRDR